MKFKGVFKVGFLLLLSNAASAQITIEDLITLRKNSFSSNDILLINKGFIFTKSKIEDGVDNYIFLRNGITESILVITYPKSSTEYPVSVAYELQDKKIFDKLKGTCVRKGYKITGYSNYSPNHSTPKTCMFSKKVGSDQYSYFTFSKNADSQKYWYTVMSQ